MSKDPAFLFYPNDYVGGTMGMTFEEKGAYMELLMMQFNRGHMTSHMIGQTVGQLWDTIKVKFVQDDDGLWYNTRLEEEKEKRRRFTESRRNNKSGNNQHTKKETGKERGHMTSHMENENENNNKGSKGESEGDFSEFWDHYHRITSMPKTDREAAKKYWKKLSKEERKLAKDNSQPYFDSLSEKKYCKKARTYLGDKNFNDEFKHSPAPKNIKKFDYDSYINPNWKPQKQ